MRHTRIHTYSKDSIYMQKMRQVLSTHRLSIKAKMKRVTKIEPYINVYRLNR